MRSWAELVLFVQRRRLLAHGFIFPFVKGQLLTSTDLYLQQGFEWVSKSADIQPFPCPHQGLQ